MLEPAQAGIDGVVVGEGQVWFCQEGVSPGALDGSSDREVAGEELMYLGRGLADAGLDVKD